MLGRLARYLRFLGTDVLYARNLADPEVAELARRDRRVLLTRDEQLSRSVTGSILIESDQIAEQFRQLARTWPDLPATLQFERCTLCNGMLRPAAPTDRARLEQSVPGPVWDRGTTVYVCADCGHAYWEGSHTAGIRARLASWAEASPP